MSSRPKLEHPEAPACRLPWKKLTWPKRVKVLTEEGLWRDQMGARMFKCQIGHHPGSRSARVSSLLLLRAAKGIQMGTGQEEHRLSEGQQSLAPPLSAGLATNSIFLCFLFVKKIIDLPEGHINDASLGEHYTLPFLPATPLSPYRTFKEGFLS